MEAILRSKSVATAIGCQQTGKRKIKFSRLKIKPHAHIVVSFTNRLAK